MRAVLLALCAVAVVASAVTPPAASAGPTSPKGPTKLKKRKG